MLGDRATFGQPGGKALITRMFLDFFQLEYGRPGRRRRLGHDLQGGMADLRRIPTLERKGLVATEDASHQTNSSPSAERLICPASASLRAMVSTSFCAASTSLSLTGPFTSRSSRSMSAARC